MIYILDTSAILRYLDGRTGGKRVDEMIEAHLAAIAAIEMSAMHWGELAGVLHKREGSLRMRQILANLETFGFHLVPVTPQRAISAALLRRQTGLSYVDSLGVELAGTSPGRVLVTADYDFKAAEHLASIDFLPSEPAETSAKPVTPPNIP